MGVNCVCTRYCKNEIIIDSFRMKELEKKIKTTKNIKLIIKIQSIYRGIHNREKLEKKFKIPKKKKIKTITPISPF